ncbi:MAG: ribulose-phosphate 3-epimerase [Clostridiales bacterium]|nr:ribulose-phosphate 3-epimerase [Clostridiales bacterium]
MIKVLPSSNPCPEEDLVEYARTLEDLGVEYMHCDVMDGVFVTNKCLPLEKIAEIRNNSNILLDVHLMVSKSYETVEKLVKIKPNIITIHYESPETISEMEKTIRLIKDNDILLGLSVKPETAIEAIAPYLEVIDLILIMSVEPGKSGQKFIPESLEKIEKAKKMIADRNIIIEVDGGINLDTYKDVVSNGAEFLVMGNAFYTSKDRKKLLTSVDKHYQN